MNTVIPNNPLSAPHLLGSRLSPSRCDPFYTPTMSGRKRKASEEPDNDRMSTSPSASPSMSARALPSTSTHRSTKRSRTGLSGGRPLAVPRLLETLSADEMRQLLQNVCDEHPELQQEITAKAPRPSIESTLSVLSKYEDDFRKAFPLGNRPTSDYSYNRVRQHLLQLIEALRDYTPQFLPPHETQTMLSLTYLEAATNMIHRLPVWDSYQHHRHKNDAYDDIAKAWALVIRESTKRAGGFHLQFGGWDSKLVEHNQKSGGSLEEALNELRAALGFMQNLSSVGGVPDERASIRQQLFSGTYGQELGVGPVAW